MSYRVYKYACRRPVAGEAEAIDQMRLRVRLWNALVELERAHAASVELVLEQLAPGADQAARPPYACSEHAAEWQKRRGPAAFSPCPEQQPAMAAYRTLRRESFKLEAVKARLGELEAERKAGVKRIQAEHAAEGLWWGNYDDVVKAYTVARRRPGDLRFHSWFTTRGKVSVRYQTGLPLATAYAETDTRFQIKPMPAGWSWETRRGQRLARTVARVRIGSEGRAPRWLELQLTQHRPIPEGSVIRQVAVTRELVGSTPRWWLLLVVDEPEGVRAVPSGPPLAINLGWRVRPDGLRVAYWRDGTGEHGELILPNAWRDQLGKTQAIRAQRDLNFNAARDALVAWLSTKPTVPEWFAEQSANLPLWQASERLARLVRRWSDERCDGDTNVFEKLSAWRQRERHLQEYEAHARDQLMAARLDQYRKFAAMVARRAGSVRLHEFDLPNVVMLGPGQAGADLPAAARENRVQSAVSIVKQALTVACERAGVAVVNVPKTERITQTCWACGTVQRFDAARYLEWTCTSCGVHFDQDDNAARNLLAWTPQTDAPHETDGSLRTDQDTPGARPRRRGGQHAVS